jgi:hypothetical protein
MILEVLLKFDNPFRLCLKSGNLNRHFIQRSACMLVCRHSWVVNPELSVQLCRGFLGMLCNGMTAPRGSRHVLPTQSYLSQTTVMSLALFTKSNSDELASIFTLFIHLLTCLNLVLPFISSYPWGIYNLATLFGCCSFLLSI